MLRYMTLAACIWLATSLQAQVNLAFNGSALSDAALYHEFVIDFGTTATSATITASVTYAPTSGGHVQLRLFDIDTLIDDPATFSNGTALGTQDLASAGVVNVSLTSPSVTGQRHYIVEVTGSNGGAWTMNGTLTSTQLTGTPGDFGTLLYDTDTVVQVGSLVRGRTAFDNTKNLVDMEFSVNLGTTLGPLTYVSSLTATNIDLFQFFAPPGVQNASIDSVEDAFEHALAGSNALALIDTVDPSTNNVNMTRFFNSTTNINGTADIRVRTWTNPFASSGDIDIVMIFAGNQQISTSKNLVEDTTNSIVIGEGLGNSAGSCALVLGTTRPYAWAFLLVTLILISAGRRLQKLSRS